MGKTMFFELPLKSYQYGDHLYEIRDSRNKIILQWQPVPVNYVEKKQLAELIKIVAICINNYFEDKMLIDKDAVAPKNYNGNDDNGKTESVIVKHRGNPAFVKGQTNPYK